MSHQERDIFITNSTSHRIPHSVIESIVEQGCIWGLRHPEGGWALCPSNFFADADVYLFWTERRLAFQSVVDEWAEFEPIAIELHEFIDNWLTGMIATKTLAGLDWDAHLDGIEFEAQALKRRLYQRLFKNKQII